MKTLYALAMFFSLAGVCCGQQIRAGYAKEDITPTEPSRLGGYSLRTGLSEGVYDGEHLYVRALAFNDGSATLLFVESDLIGTHGQSAFREKIAAATGIPLDHVLCGDVHNHAAPVPKPDGESAFDKRYGEAIVTAAKRAVTNLQPVCIAAGEGHSRVAMNRRQVRPADAESAVTYDENHVSQSFGKEKTDTPIKLKEFGGVVRLGANPTGPIDDAVQLVRIDDMAGKPVALMIHYACHGTSLGGRNAKISAEWMGRMEARAEQQFPGLGAMFVQGAAGDINPRIVGGLDGHKDDIQTTRALGDEIGDEVIRVYRQLSPQPIKARIELVSKEIELPRTYRELFLDYRDTAVKVPTTVVRIGPLMWVSFPGELFSAIGKQVKAACPSPHAHLMGYTNGSIGYFPTQQAFSQGGYEPSTSHLDPAAEPIYMREIATLMKDLP